MILTHGEFERSAAALDTLSSYYSGLLASPEIYLTKDSIVSFDGVVLRAVRCSEVAWTLVHMLSQFPTIAGLGDSTLLCFLEEIYSTVPGEALYQVCAVCGDSIIHLSPPLQLCHEPSAGFENDD